MGSDKEVDGSKPLIPSGPMSRWSISRIWSPSKGPDNATDHVSSLLTESPANRVQKPYRSPLPRQRIQNQKQMLAKLAGKSALEKELIVENEPDNRVQVVIGPEDKASQNTTLSGPTGFASQPAFIAPLSPSIQSSPEDAPEFKAHSDAVSATPNEPTKDTSFHDECPPPYYDEESLFVEDDIVDEDHNDPDNQKDGERVFNSNDDAPENANAKEDEQSDDESEIIIDIDTVDHESDAQDNDEGEGLPNTGNLAREKVVQEHDLGEHLLESDTVGHDDDSQDVEMSDEIAEEEELWTFSRILDYRWNGDQIELFIQWTGGEKTWEPETNIHMDAPEALFAYWRSLDGRPENPTDPDMYDIFAIRDHSKNRQRVLVEWTGYPPTENTWVSRREVQKTAPKVVSDYFQSVSKPKK